MVCTTTAISEGTTIHLSYVKVVFIYSAVSSPLDRSKRFTLFASTGRPVHSDTNPAFPGSIHVAASSTTEVNDLC